MNEYSAQARAAMAASALLLRGPQRPADFAAQVYDSEEDGWYLFNNISDALKLGNAGGWWYVQITPYADLCHLLSVVEKRVEEISEEAAFCRPLTRADMVRLRNLLRHMAQIGTPRAE